MRSHRPWLFACLLAAGLPSDARAQRIAASFDDLARVVRAGDVLYVTDTSGVTTWGRVNDVSESSLTLVVMKRDANRAATLITTERRVFTAHNLARVNQSDLSGRAGPVIYPASWDEVHHLPPGTDVAIVLDTGEQRKYRLRTVDGDVLHLIAAAGREDAIEKRRIRRVRRRGFDDSTANGLALGAAAGAGTMFVLTLGLYSTCGPSCDAPAYSEMFPATTAFGAGTGAVVGWLIDKLHRGTDDVFPAAAARAPAIGVQPVVSARQRGARVTISW